MKELDQIERIKIKLRLAKSTDFFLEVFGASSHQYHLGRTIAIEEINAFENQYNFKLPIGYKKFLTEIGNGGSKPDNLGAGPDYGLFEFKEVLGNELSLKYLNQKPFFNENITQEKWNEIYDKMDDNLSDEAYDIEVAKAYSGILNIGYSGCSAYLGIMVNGKNTGRIVHTYEEIEYLPRFAEEINFLDWYENWLDDIIAGKNIIKKTIMEKEENYIHRFLSDKETHWKLISLSHIKSFDTLSNSSIQILNNAYKKEDNRKIKLYLLNTLTKFDYQNSKQEIKELAENNPLFFLVNLHLYNKEKSNEWINEINLIKQNDNNKEIQEYIEYISLLDINLHQ